MPPKTPAWKKNKKAQEAKEKSAIIAPFKGKGRTIEDTLKAQEERKENAPPPPPKPQKEAEEIDETPWIPKPAPVPEVMPGPGQRFVKITKAPDGVEFKPPASAFEVTDDDYKLKASDIITKNYGQPKTFADVRKVVKATPLVAKIKFDIRANKTIFSIEAQFATKETIDDVYEFLEKEIFEECEKIEIFNTFPRQLIPKDGKTLAQLKITGSVMLAVVATGNVVLKH